MKTCQSLGIIPEGKTYQMIKTYFSEDIMSIFQNWAEFF